MGKIASLFPDEAPHPVTHEEARHAAQDLIDHFFRSEPRKGGGVLISIPARPDNTDLLLLRYIEEQQAKDTPNDQICGTLSQICYPLARSEVAGCLREYFSDARATGVSLLESEALMLASLIVDRLFLLGSSLDEKP